MFGLASKFLRAVLPGVLIPARVLWNEIIGFLFLALAVLSAKSVWTNIRDFDGSPDAIFRVFLSVSFELLMLFFGITSFLRARRIKRRAAQL